MTRSSLEDGTSGMRIMPLKDPSDRCWWSRRRLWALAGVLSFVLLVFLASTSRTARDAINRLQSPHHDNNGRSRYAYCIFLSDDDTKEQKSIDEDNYFVATRILLYQLLHAPDIATSYDVVVAVTNTVRAEKRERLNKDGAEVVVVEPLDSGWVRPAFVHEYDSVMQKMRIWQMTQYEKILILDSDIVLQTNIDGVFEQGVAAAPLARPDIVPLKGEAPYPAVYVLAGNEELSTTHMSYPPQTPDDLFEGGGYMNAGFILLKPSEEVFQYYMSFTTLDPVQQNGRKIFDPEMPEQNMLNYVHRWDGPMPWTRLDPLRTLHVGVLEDLKARPRTIHTKWWDPLFRLQLEHWKWRMEAFWEGREGSI